MQPKATYVDLPGPVGLSTTATIAHMLRLIREAAADPDFRAQALAIVRACDGRDYACQIRTLRAWLKRHYRFARDPWAVEWVTAPATQLAVMRAGGVFKGDCDDAAVLSAALARTLGFPAGLVLLSFDPRPNLWAHVYTRVLVPGTSGTGAQWVDLDITRPPTVRQPPAAWSFLGVP